MRGFLIDLTIGIVTVSISLILILMALLTGYITSQEEEGFSRTPSWETYEPAKSNLKDKKVN